MLLSGSRLPLAKHCQYPFRPDILAPPYTTSAAAELGTAVHAIPAALINGTEVPEQTIEVASFKMEGHVRNLLEEWGENLEAELAFAYNPVSGGVRLLGKDIGRDYNVKPGEIPLSLDVCGLSPDGTALVRDWKTGDADRVDPARENLQLGVGALCALVYYSCTNVVVELAFVDASGHVRVDRHHHDAISLLDIEAQVKRIYAGIDNANPKPGWWCNTKYCPVRMSCPETVRAQCELVRVETTTLEHSLAVHGPQDIVNHEHAAWLLHRLGAVEGACRVIRDALKGFADKSGPVPIEEDKYWGNVESCRESICASSPDEIYSALSELITPEAFAELINVSVAKEKISDVIKAVHGQAGVKKAFDALRRAGLIKKSVFHKHDFYKPRKGK